MHHRESWIVIGGLGFRNSLLVRLVFIAREHSLQLGPIPTIEKAVGILIA